MSCRSKASGSAAGQEQGRHSSGGKILRKAVLPVTKQGMAAAGWGNPSREHSGSLPRAVPSRAVPAPRLQRAQRPRRSRPGEPPPPPSPPVPPKSLHTCALPGTFWGKKAFFWFRLVGLLKRFAVRSDRAGCVCCATAAGAERVGEAVGSWASSVSKYGSAAPGQQPSPRPDFLALTSPSVQVSAGSCLRMTLNRRLFPCPHRTRTKFSAVCWHEVSSSRYPSVHAGESPRAAEHLESHPSWQLVSPVCKEAFSGYDAGAVTSLCTVLQGRGRGEVSTCATGSRTPRCLVVESVLQNRGWKRRRENSPKP